MALSVGWRLRWGGGGGDGIGGEWKTEEGEGEGRDGGKLSRVAVRAEEEGG